MKAAVLKEQKASILPELLNEYEEECLQAIRLMEGLKLKTLTEGQKEDMLGELSASITHLRIHSEQLEKLIDAEL